MILRPIQSIILLGFLAIVALTIDAEKPQDKPWRVVLKDERWEHFTVASQLAKYPSLNLSAACCQITELSA